MNTLAIVRAHLEADSFSDAGLVVHHTSGETQRFHARNAIKKLKTLREQLDAAEAELGAIVSGQPQEDVA